MIRTSKITYFTACAFLLFMAGCQKKNKKVLPVYGKFSTQETITDDSGKDRVIQIVNNIQHSVVPSHTQPIQYAQVQNINHDLNIEKIVEYFDCKTIMGKTFLIETLNHPISPTDTSNIIAHRKKAISQLMENPELKNEIDEILQLAAKQEQLIIQLMSDYFIGKTCPELQGLALLKSQKSSFYSVTEFCTTNRSMKTVGTALQVLSLMGSIAGTIGCGISAANAAHAGLNYGELTVFTAYFGLLTSLYAYIIHDDFAKAGEKRSKMYALNQLIQGAERIEQLCDKYQVQNQFKMSLIQDPKGVELVKGLKHCRYKKNKSYCFNTPAVHTFLYKVYKNDKHLAQMFASIAEMDAYNAIATKMLASKNSDNKFCFAEFVDAKNPMMSSTSFWNVLIPHAVTNNLDQDRNIILTGPNAGGKTSAIRSILQNIIFAQTYGFAAAEKFVYTQFDVILSYLNISDDLVQGHSLFASEIKRAQELLQTIKSLMPHQKLFFALDELFTGTALQGGEETSYQFVDKISGFNQVLSIYATHFDLLKKLETTHRTLVNYKVDAPIKNSEGKLMYSYKLSPGSSDICVALDMAKEAGLFN